MVDPTQRPRQWQDPYPQSWSEALAGVERGGSVTPGPVGAMHSQRDTGGNLSQQRWNELFNEEWNRSHDPHKASMYANQMTGNQQFQLPHDYDWPQAIPRADDPPGGPAYSPNYHAWTSGPPGMSTPLEGRYPTPDWNHRFDAQWNQRWNDLFNQEWTRTHSNQGARLFADLNMGRNPGRIYGLPPEIIDTEAEKRVNVRARVNPFTPPFEPWKQATSGKSKRV